MNKIKLFNSDILRSESFSGLPTSARVLYIHLLMETDDDGVCDHPKAVCRSARVNTDDLLLLLSAGFLLPRTDGVLVVNSVDPDNPYDAGDEWIDQEGGVIDA